MTSLSCPCCGADQLADGFIVGRSPGVKFKPQADLLGDLTGATLTTGVFSHSAPALRCPQCGTVVVPGPGVTAAR